MVRCKETKCMVGEYWLWMMGGDMRGPFKITYFMVRGLYLTRIVCMLAHFKMVNVMDKGL